MTWDDLKTQPLVVYSTAWCPDCHRLKRVLKNHGVPFEEIDIDADSDAAEFLRHHTSRTAIPYVRLDGNVFVRGWMIRFLPRGMDLRFRRLLKRAALWTTAPTSKQLWIARILFIRIYAGQTVVYTGLGSKDTKVRSKRM